MTENTHHDPAALDKLTEPFTVLPERQPHPMRSVGLIDKPTFGQVFSDNMTHMTWTRAKVGPTAANRTHRSRWIGGFRAALRTGVLRGPSRLTVMPTAPPGCSALDTNAERFQNSAKRLYLPELPIDDFTRFRGRAGQALGANWVPSPRVHAVHASIHVHFERFLGVRAQKSTTA